MLKQLLSGLSHLVPAEVSFEGSGFVVVSGVVIIALALFSLLLKAVIASVSDPVKDWLKQDSRGIRILILCLPLLASAAVARPMTIAVMTGLAAAVGILHWRSWVRFRVAGLVVIVFVTFLASLWLEGRILDQRQRRFAVYVVLPFQNFHGEDAQTRLNLSKSLLSTFNGIFGSLADVKIEPATFKVVQDLDEWNEMTPVAQRLEDRGVRPDVMLANLGTLTDDPGRNQILNLVLRPRFAVAGKRGVTFNWQQKIVATGRLQDIEYLSIRASLELVAQLETLQRKPLTPVDETLIVRNAVTAYLTQLQIDGACPTAACTAAQAALAKPAITLDEGRNLIRIFPPDEGPRLNAIHASRATAATRILGLAEPAANPE